MVGWLTSHVRLMGDFSKFINHGRLIDKFTKLQEFRLLFKFTINCLIITVIPLLERGTKVLWLSCVCLSHSGHHPGVGNNGEQRLFRCNRFDGCISRNRIFTHWLTDSLTDLLRALSSLQGILTKWMDWTKAQRKKGKKGQ